MVKKLRDLVPESKVFENETTTQLKKENLENESFRVLAHSDLFNSADGDFMVLLCEHNGEKFTTTAAKILYKPLERYGEAVGYKQDEGALGECFFKEPCEVTLKRIKSKNGSRSYFVFE